MISIIKLIRKKTTTFYDSDLNNTYLLTSLRNWNTPDRTFTVLLSTNKPTNESLQRSKQIKNNKITKQWQLTQNKLKNKKLRKSIALLLLSKTLPMAMSEVKKFNHDVELNDPFNKINRKRYIHW